MSEENNTESVFMPIIRHVVQATGVTLVNYGIINTDDLQALTGIAISVIAVLWGICKRRKVEVCQ
jgi:hypothetical protein